MKFKKIVSKDKTFISLTSDGQIWTSHDGRSFSSCGTIVHGACNVHKPCSLDKKYDKYFAVQFKLLRFAERFEIRKLRLIHNFPVWGKYGWIYKTRYGYVSAKKFKYLMKRRKHVTAGNANFILLKHTDIDWKRE